MILSIPLNLSSEHEQLLRIRALLAAFRSNAEGRAPASSITRLRMHSDDGIKVIAPRRRRQIADEAEYFPASLENGSASRERHDREHVRKRRRADSEHIWI